MEIVTNRMRFKNTYNKTPQPASENFNSNSSFITSDAIINPVKTNTNVFAQYVNTSQKWCMVCSMFPTKKATFRADVKSHAHARQHARDVKNALGNHKRQVTREQRQSNLYQMVSEYRLEPKNNQLSGDDANEQSAKRLRQEHQKHIQRSLVFAFTNLKKQREHDDSGTIVHQRLAFNHVP